MLRNKMQYEAACEELRFLGLKDGALGLTQLERIRFEALAEQVSFYEEDPAVFHRRFFEQDTGRDPLGTRLDGPSPI